MNDEFIHAIAGYASLVPLLCGLLLFRKAGAGIKYLTLLLAIASLTELIGIVLSAQKVSNLFLFHTYPLLEYLMFLLIYRLHFQSPKLKKLLWTSGVFFLLFSAFNSFFIQSLNEFNTYGRAVESLLLSLLALSYMVINLGSITPEDDKGQPMFWINTAVLIYFPLNLVFILMSNFLLHNFSDDFHRSLWNIHAILSLGQYVLFTIAIYQEWKSTKLPALS